VQSQGKEKANTRNGRVKVIGQGRIKGNERDKTVFKSSAKARQFPRQDPRKSMGQGKAGGMAKQCHSQGTSQGWGKIKASHRPMQGSQAEKAMQWIRQEKT
jgi:hypothetical protein